LKGKKGRNGSGRKLEGKGLAFRMGKGKAKRKKKKGHMEKVKRPGREASGV